VNLYQNLPYTVSVPYGVAEIRRRKYTFHPDVIDWCKTNLKGKWRVHRSDDPTNSRARFSIDRPVTAAASFSDMADATLFKMFWGEQ